MENGRVSTKAISVCGWLAACGALASGLLSLTGCSGGAGSEFRSLPIDDAWTFGTADYSAQTAPEDVVTKVEPLPAPFTGSGLVLAATNRSDDALVYAVRVVDGLPPGSKWDVGVDPEIVTQTPTGCPGVGGSPGESVWMVASAAGKPIAPVTIDGETRLDLDRGNQSQGGPQGVVLGTIAGTSTNCSGDVPAESKSFLAGAFLRTKADAQGRIWVMVGMDSGFEARSRVWIRSVRLRLRPA
jgi:hypothetical protein